MKQEFCIETTADYPTCHASSICQLPGGDLLACCYTGKQEGAPDQVIIGSRYTAQEGRWSRPEVWVSVTNRAAGNPRIFMGPEDGEVWLVAPVDYGAWCSGGTWLFLKRSRDEGRTWSDLELLHFQPGILGKNKPLVEGRLCILPVEYEVPWSTCFLRTEDAGKTWEVCGDLGREVGAHLIQPSLVRLSDGRLVVYMRSQEDRIFSSYSHDNGKTWSLAKPTDVPNNNSGLDVARLRSGNLVLVCNPTTSNAELDKLDQGWPAQMPIDFDTWGLRTPLDALVSVNEGVTWKRAIRLEDGPSVYSYPAVIQSDDGLIHITYTYERRAIKHVALSEDELLEGMADSGKRGLQ